MDQVSLRANAKINLTLDVVGRRNDGYHLLESVMQSVSLADQIDLRLQGRGITIETEHPAVPTDEGNICWQAAHIFRRYIRMGKGVHIKLTKKIPLNAGLGGGSTDAAAVFHGLNALFKAKLSLRELQALGLEVGADVPFCLQGGTALVQGVGERVTAINPFPRVSLVLVKPKKGASTAAVYQGLSPSAFGGRATLDLVSRLQAQESLAELGQVLGNTLETVTIGLVPEISTWKERLINAGAINALMTGSGTTVFGLFASDETAVQFKRQWADQAEVYVVQPETSGVKLMNGGNLQ